MAMWQTLSQWAKAHGVTPRSVIKMIEDGVIGNEDYFRHGRKWRIRKDPVFHNPKTVQLPPCRDFLKELEAV